MNTDNIASIIVGLFFLVNALLLLSTAFGWMAAIGFVMLACYIKD